jgi:GNAT superfamily N-acetyltransferase
MMRVREGLELVRTSHGRRWFWVTARQRIHSSRVSMCLRRDVNVPFTPPPAKIPVVARQLRPDDDLSFIAHDPELSPQDAQYRADQRWLLSSDLPTCWVVTDPDGTVCFMTWMLLARDNARIQALWGNWLPELQPDEALFEGIYTAESHRGLGIMAVAADQILETARDSGVRYGLGFIGTSNAPSIKGGEKGGFIPFMKREESWFLLRRRVRFLPVANAAS